jgi:hypothetical protein
MEMGRLSIKPEIPDDGISGFVDKLGKADGGCRTVFEKFSKVLHAGGQIGRVGRVSVRRWQDAG